MLGGELYFPRDEPLDWLYQKPWSLQEMSMQKTITRFSRLNFYVYLLMSQNRNSLKEEGHQFWRERRGSIWEQEKGKRRRKWYNYILVKKNFKCLPLSANRKSNLGLSQVLQEHTSGSLSWPLPMPSKDPSCSPFLTSLPHQSLYPSSQLRRIPVVQSQVYLL